MASWISSSPTGPLSARVLYFALPFTAALVATAALTPAVRAFARAVGLIARPTSDRWHARPTALLGGIAVYGGFIVGAALPLAQAPGGEAFRTEWAGIVAAATLMFLVGLVDDKVRLRPATKMIFQGIAAAIVISCGVVYPVTPWFVLNVLLTFFWFLALTNALNLLDNMDGVAIGVAGIAALFLAGAFAWEGAWTLTGICLALAGAAAGFLPYNFHRASIFMGDSGSLFVGALLASLGAAYPGAASASIVSVLFIPAAIVILPILDTTLVTIARTLAGRPISVGGRDHTSHRLAALGLTERGVAILLYAVSTCGGLVAVLLRGAPPDLALPVGSIFVAGLLIFTAYLGRLHTYEPWERPAGRVTLLVSNLLHKRRAFELVLDLILFAAAYQLAFLLRWDGALPADQAALFERTLAVAVVAKAAAFGLLGVYRGAWHQLAMADVHRLARGTLLGGILTVGLVRLLEPAAAISWGAYALDAILAGLLVVGARTSFQSLELVRHSLDRTGKRALIYGAGRTAGLLINEIIANRALGIRPVGFVDDDPDKHGRRINGYRILGDGRDLRRLVETYRVSALVLCSRKLSPVAVEELKRCCDALGIELLKFNLELQLLPAPERGAGGQLRAGHA
ncbi:MAG: hypothetical protein IRZ00_19420 [Gemmatimonadetes bacterium]|nr:hypothetical protein [Gemmatimonadota bacterium]